MTTYILHGGIKYGTNQLLADMTFWPEIVRKMPKPARILCIYSAIDSDRWPDELDKDKARMAKNANSEEIRVECGSKDPKTMLEQIKQADVIYIRGGYSNKLVTSALMKMENLKQAFEGKIVAGSSAGAYALSKYYCNKRGELGQGLGIVPCKVLAHYVDARKADKEKLKNIQEDLPIYALAEEEYVTLEL